MHFIYCLIICFCVVVVKARLDYAIDERWVCNVKRNCYDCLKLSHCSWCGTMNKCYSKNLPAFKDFCKNDTVDHIDYGLSIAENADCSCAGGKVDLRCYPPGSSDGPQCSGRGQCVCGHCVCNPNPDPENPTKTIMGEYCEYDNFSCDGPKCNEGPYSLSQPVILDDDSEKYNDSDNIPPTR